MSRRIRRMGHVQAEVLDGLDRHGPMSRQDLAEELGKDPTQIHQSLRSLLRARCVGREGHAAHRGPGRRGCTPWVYWITPAGRRELDLRRAAGIAPGVVRTYPDSGAYLKEVA